MIVRTCTAVAFMLIASAANAGGSRSGFDLGLSLGGGYTSVNFEKASGYSDEYLDDWGQGHFKATLYALAPLASKFKAGIEIGYNDLYWWYYRIPYVPSSVYRSAEWSTLSVLAVMEKDLPGIFFTRTGAGIHFFDGDPALSLTAAFGIKPRIKNFGIPVCLRVDPIFGAGFPITIALGAGLEFSASAR